MWKLPRAHQSSSTSAEWVRQEGAQTKPAQREARPCFFGQLKLKQTGGAKACNRIRYRHGLTLIKPARHRDSQSRITQVPELHKFLPTPELTWGVGNSVRREANLTWLYRQVQTTKVLVSRRKVIRK